MSTTRSLSVVALLVVGLAPQALANDPPENYSLKFLLREDPQDLTSDVLYEVLFDLSSDSWNQDEVDWSIDELTISKLDANGNPEASWATINPYGGLWSVVHGDPANPLPTEFDFMPYMSGLAAAKNAKDEDLLFTFESALFDPPGPWPPIPTGEVDYDFELEDSLELVAEGTDEPAEIQEEDDDEN